MGMALTELELELGYGGRGGREREKGSGLFIGDAQRKGTKERGGGEIFFRRSPDAVLRRCVRRGEGAADRTTKRRGAATIYWRRRRWRLMGRHGDASGRLPARYFSSSPAICPLRPWRVIERDLRRDVEERVPSGSTKGVHEHVPSGARRGEEERRRERERGGRDGGRRRWGERDGADKWGPNETEIADRRARRGEDARVRLGPWAGAAREKFFCRRIFLPGLAALGIGRHPV